MLYDQLRELVAKDRRSQTEIAGAADVHPVSLSRFMTGAAGLSVEAAEKVASALGFDIALVKAKRKAGRADPGRAGTIPDAATGAEPRRPDREKTSTAMKFIK